jgi:hypothetical protein
LISTPQAHTRLDYTKRGIPESSRKISCYKRPLNHIKIELIPILEELREMDIKGANAYESEINHLLEAFMCDGVKL